MQEENLQTVKIYQTQPRMNEKQTSEVKSMTLDMIENYLTCFLCTQYNVKI